MRPKLLLLALLAGNLSLIGNAQDKSKIKFGDVTADDFKQKRYPVDSNASAVVIADIGSTEIVGNNKASFSLVFKNFRRAHISNKNGYDISNVEISLYTNGDAEEKLENLKAITYNLENGKVVETKLDVKSAVFKDKINKNRFVKKFTFPNVKEGSIIEYEYKIQSDFIFNLQPWDFQGEHPRIWSEYSVAIPEFYSYVTLTQGYQPFAVNDKKHYNMNFQVADIRGAGATARDQFGANVTEFRWAMKDVPALNEESFTSTLRNHIARIEFQLSSVGAPAFRPQQVMSTWDVVAKNLMNDEDFGAQLKKDNGWLNDVMPLAVKNAGSNLEKAKSIYAWVRDNFTCTNHNRTSLDQNLKNVLKNRNGNVAEINLLLVAMLRKIGVQADPVILSTKSHGYTHTIYPLMDRFNYVTCLMAENGKVYLLDASEPRMGFAKVGYKCYNGTARIIDERGTALELSSDVLKEEKLTSVFIINDEKGNSIGSVQQTPGYFESSRVRSLVKEKGKEQLFKDIKKEFGTEVTIKNEVIDSLEKLEEPVGLKYEIDLNPEKADILYVNPMFGEAYKENPFKSAVRVYPVEMPYTMDETFNLQLQVPAGYVVDELPKQTIVKFNEEEDALFEYRISQSGDNISLRSRLQIKRANFEPEEYEILREFFNFIVKKHSEQIVFKKK